MVERDDESELERARREANEAAARLRRLKQQLIPRDRAAALDELMKAELSAMIRTTLPQFEQELIEVKSEAEARAILERMRDAMLAGTERVEAAMRGQMHAWTLAGIEDRAAEDARD